MRKTKNEKTKDPANYPPPPPKRHKYSVFFPFTGARVRERSPRVLELTPHSPFTFFGFRSRTLSASSSHSQSHGRQAYKMEIAIYLYTNVFIYMIRKYSHAYSYIYNILRMLPPDGVLRRFGGAAPEIFVFFLRRLSAAEKNVKVDLKPLIKL